MNTERLVRLIAGTLVLTSLGLGWFVSPYFYWLGVFVGANLFQSALTGWCLAEQILMKFGVPVCCPRTGRREQQAM